MTQCGAERALPKKTMKRKFSEFAIRHLDDTTIWEEVTKWINQDMTATPLKYWDVSQVTRMDDLFNGSRYRTSVPADMWEDPDNDITEWNVRAVTHMTNMFANTPFNQNLSRWVTTQVVAMNGMFANNPVFNQPLNAWTVSSVTTMARMFFNARQFNQDLSRWDVSQVVDMRHMFEDAKTFHRSLFAWTINPQCLTMQMFRRARSFRHLLPPTMMNARVFADGRTAAPAHLVFASSGTWRFYEDAAKDAYSESISLREFVPMMNQLLKNPHEELSFHRAANSRSTNPIYNLFYHADHEGSGLPRLLREWVHPDERGTLYTPSVDFRRGHQAGRGATRRRRRRMRHNEITRGYRAVPVPDMD